MHLFETIADYYKHYGHTPPKVSFFDIRPFEQFYEEEVSGKEVFEMKPFRVEFYGIGLLTEGTAAKHLGKPFNANVVFYSPYQILSFEGVYRNWKGYYTFFDRDFLNRCSFGTTFLADFPFLRLDNVHPVKVSEEIAAILLPLFKNISAEFTSDKEDKFSLIEIYLNLVLHHLKRSTAALSIVDTDYRNKAEINLIAQYKGLIESTLAQSKNLTALPLSPAWYAEHLHIHQNHLNAVAKRVTGRTAKQLIHDAVIHFAKSLLIQSQLSAKEVGYRLGFEEPAHFNNFFKKHTSLTPMQYRLMQSAGPEKH